MPDQTFPRSARVRTKSEFDRVFERRKSASDGLLIVYAEENGLSHARLGLVVSRKVGKAILRNRWKRLIREAFRLTKTDLPAGLDLVCLPQRGAEATLAGLCASLPRLAARCVRALKRDSHV